MLPWAAESEPASQLSAGEYQYLKSVILFNSLFPCSFNIYYQCYGSLRKIRILTPSP